MSQLRVLFFLGLLSACSAAPEHASPVSPRPDAAAAHDIRAEFRGRVAELYTMGNPAQRPVVLEHCGPGALSYTVAMAQAEVAHLGRTHVVLKRCQRGLAWTAEVTLTAANGDEISGLLAGGGTAPNAAGDYTWYADPLHFDQGTGRFAQVLLEGSWTGGGNVDGSGYSTLIGTLSYQASDRAAR